MQNTGSAYHAVMLCEATRYLEEVQPQMSTHADNIAKDSGGDFSQRILKRAQHLDSAPMLQAILNRLISSQKKAIVLLGLLVFIAGYFFAKLLLLSQNDQGANIYVLLTALVLPNLFSLLLFCFLYYKNLSFESFNLASIVQALVSGIAKSSAFFKRPEELASAKGLHTGAAYKTYYQACHKAWQGVHLQGAFAKQSLASLNHSLWLSFLMGSLLAVITRLLTHHYHFGWESTLLPDYFFITLTQLLSFPLALLNVALPTAEQIALSNLKDGFSMSMLISKRWSFFLLAAFILYAVLPRMLLTLVFLLKATAAKRRLFLDTRQLAYSNLYQRLMLHAVDTQIIDADAGSSKTQALQKKAPTADDYLAFDITSIKKATPYMTIECDLSLMTGLDKRLVYDENYLGVAVDRDSQQRLIQRLRHTDADTVILMISLLSVPERGIKRYVQQLRSIKAQTVVFLLEQQRALERLTADEFSQRLYDWHVALAEIGIAYNNVAIVDLGHPNLVDKLIGAA